MSGSVGGEAVGEALGDLVEEVGGVRPRVLVATRNRKKAAELHRILEPVVHVTLVTLDDVPAYAEAPETGLTFAENALLKAREAVLHTGLPAVADDSGLVVDALNGMPGVFSARWAGRHGDDAANLDLVIAQLSDVPEANRGAAFVCAAALVLPDGQAHREYVVEGRVDGTLTRKPRGTNGFGYDPIFVPVGESRTTAEMSAAEKDTISHRGKAFRELASVLAGVRLSR